MTHPLLVACLGPPTRELYGATQSKMGNKHAHGLNQDPGAVLNRSKECSPRRLGCLRPMRILLYFGLCGRYGQLLGFSPPASRKNRLEMVPNWSATAPSGPCSFMPGGLDPVAVGHQVRYFWLEIPRGQAPESSSSGSLTPHPRPKPFSSCMRWWRRGSPLSTSLATRCWKGSGRIRMLLPRSLPISDTRTPGCVWVCSPSAVPMWDPVR